MTPPNPTRAIALLSGGLDSTLAVRILQEQGILVEALNFRTMFTCCQETASQAAAQLGVRLSVIGAEDDYLDTIRRPTFGYGRGANPCVDCRIYMFQRARAYMDQVGASVIVSGEVLGQRPNSQKRRDLRTIEVKSGLEGRLLRPLSAKLLSPTIPERDGLIDREKLYDFVGRSRKGLIALARRFGFAEDQIPSPSTGCMLTESSFGPRVHDLIQLDKNNSAWDFELLKLGRHIRLDSSTKCIVGRNESENDQIEYLWKRADSRGKAILRPHNFSGPVVLIVGQVSDASLDFAGALMLRFTNDVHDARVAHVERDGRREFLELREDQAAATAEMLR